MKLLFVVLLLAACLCAHTESEYHTMFLNWMRQNAVKYNGVQEFFYRYKIFHQNVDFVEKYNSEKHTMKVALNLFADLTNAEYRSKYLSNMFLEPSIPHPMKYASNLPKSVDHRKSGAVTEVKAQGQCGSCWAFSAVAAIEGAWKLKKGKLVDLSEQQLVDCCKPACHGCKGGIMEGAFQCVIDQKGIDKSECYPYEEADNKCRFKTTCIGATLSAYKQINQDDENDLQENIVHQPVSVAIDASHMSFQFYSDGIYEEPDCSHEDIDHGVTAVGFDENEDGKYYIVKNSWGKTWGQDGYIWMPRQKENYCAIAHQASYPIV